VRAEPPLEAGAVKERATSVFPRVRVSDVGGLGVVTGITLFEALEAELVPMLLVAVIVKVYVVPLVRPVTVMGDDEPEAVAPPGLAVTV